MHKKFLWAVVLLLLLSVPSYSEEYTVRNANSSGEGSLYWAINNANGLKGSGHIINFNADVKKIVLDEEIPINAGITINGGGATLTGSGGKRLFNITSGDVVFNALTFTNGESATDGGAVRIEGTGASAEFNNCTFYGNKADSYGGAVCVVNSTAETGAKFTYCTVAGNSAGTGGGLAVLKGNAEVYASIFVGNTATNDIHANSGASLSGQNNVTGSSNVSLGSGNLAGLSLKDVLITNTDGTVKPETVNSVTVLKLSGTSKARDYVRTTSYNIDKDEAGTSRPQLSQYDAGAYEALPVPVRSADIYGLPYMQTNGTDTYTLEYFPEDATVDSIEWKSSNTNVVTVDGEGHATAKDTGTAKITVDVNGWDESGNLKTTQVSSALTVYVGDEACGELQASISIEQDEMTINSGDVKYVTPEVSISLNGHSASQVKSGLNYTIEAESSDPEVVEADVVNSGTVRLTHKGAGTAEVTVTARPLPSGSAMRDVITVTATGERSNDGYIGRSGGGGCSAGIVGVAGMILLFAFIHKKEKQYAE